MMKRWLAALVCLAAAGCAAPGARDIGLNQLERETYQRASRRLPMDFVQIQRAVFRHQQACGSQVSFAVDEREPTYARITKPFKAGAQGLSETMVLGLTMMSDLTTKADVFSYYVPTKGQINAMYNIVLRPDLCPGQPGAEDWIEIDKQDEDEEGLSGPEPGIKIL